MSKLWRWPLAVLVAGPALRAASVESERAHDLVIYDATPAGIAYAVRAAREGLDVLLVSHSAHVGGILSSGLSVFDTLYNGPRSPIYDELRQGIHDYYRTRYGADSAQFKASLPGYPKTRYEAHVMEELLGAMIAREKRITLVTGWYPVAVRREGRTIAAVTFAAMGGGRQFTVRGTVFADCSYEADLAAAAKVPYRVGRESRAEFNEPHGGRILMRPVTWPPPDAEAIAANRSLNLVRYNRAYEVIPVEREGEADPAVQAYNLRTVLTDDPANRLPVVKPEHYDPAALRQLRYSQLIGPLPNRKYCWNLPELVGVQTEYVEGDWAARRKVYDAHRDATLGLLYFIQHDPSVPAEVRAKWSVYGLPKDEFAENGHLPWEIYVREARRIVGRAVFTENDCRLAPQLQRAPLHADSIASTDWFLDSHACTPVEKGDSLYEGEFLLNNLTWPGQVSYRTLLPRDIDNLLVLGGISSSHVGFGALRLEPTWMTLGESSAFATMLAVRHQVTPAAVNPEELVRTLATHGILISYFSDIDVSRDTAWYAAVQYLGTRGFFASYDARPYVRLTTSLAQAWAGAAAALATGRSDDVAERAAAMGRAEAVRDVSTVTAKEFSAMIKASLPADSPLGTRVTTLAETMRLPADIPISRGDAARLVFELTLSVPPSP